MGKIKIIDIPKGINQIQIPGSDIIIRFWTEKELEKIKIERFQFQTKITIEDHCIILMNDEFETLRDKIIQDYKNKIQ